MDNIVLSSKTGSNNEHTTHQSAGAYIHRDPEGSGSSSIPIYNSISKYGHTKAIGKDDTVLVSISSDTNNFDDDSKAGYQYYASHSSGDSYVSVLPGYKLVTYRLIDYQTSNTGSPILTETFDNKDGIEILFQNVTHEIGSLKLYHKDKSNMMREVFPYDEHIYTVPGGTLRVHARSNGSDSEDIRYDDTTPSSVNTLLKFYDVGRIQYIGTGTLDIPCLVVAGGGASGSPRDKNDGGNFHYGSGGGGAGGYGEGTFSLVPNTTYEISVGRGGTGTPYPGYYDANFYNKTSGYPGEDTIITDGNELTITAYGGGPGAANDPCTNRGGSSGGGMDTLGNYIYGHEGVTRGTITKGSNTSSMLFFGNPGAGYYPAGAAGSGGGGAGGYGDRGGKNINSSVGVDRDYGGGNGGVGRKWKLTGDTIYSGGGAGGGANVNGWGFWQTGSHGGGNFVGGGGGGTGLIGWNAGTSPGYSGIVILSIPKVV
tara:strand:+ start:24 stop:1472 length:1449 start_codon:yes stop_codon:yes gene_type:complete